MAMMIAMVIPEMMPTQIIMEAVTEIQIIQRDLQSCCHQKFGSILSLPILTNVSKSMDQPTTGVVNVFVEIPPRLDSIT